jgi:hypothetical protein
MSRLATVGVALALILAGCGGGGSTSTDPPAPPPVSSSYDLQAAMAALEANGLSAPVRFSGTVIGGGSSYSFAGTGTLSLSPGKSGTFDGGTALLQTTTIAGTATTGGSSAAYDLIVVSAYDSATAAIVGQSQGTEFDVASAPIMIPSSISTMPVVLGTLNRYTDNTMSVALGTIQISVDVKLLPVDPGSREVVEFTLRSYDMSGAPAGTDTRSYYLTADSVLSFFGYTASDASGSLSVTAQ